MNLGCDPTKLSEADLSKVEAWVSIRAAGTRNTISSPDTPTGLQGSNASLRKDVQCTDLRKGMKREYKEKYI